MLKTYTYSNSYKYRIERLLLILFLVVISLFTYWGSFSNEFLVHFDDGKLILNNLLIKDFSLNGVLNLLKNRVYGLYHPLTSLSWMIEYHFFNVNPNVYHLTNLILHILNGILVFWSSMLLIKNKAASFLIAIVFIVHPMHVESVAWLSERKDLLYTFFFFISILFYQKYICQGLQKKYMAFTFLFFILSALSKSAAVVLPVLLFLYDYYYQRKFSKWLILEKLPFFAISIILGLVNIIAQKSDNFLTDLSQNYNLIDRLLMVNYSIGFYIFKFFLPINLSAKYFYPLKQNGFLPISFYLSIIILIAFFVLFYYRKKVNKTIWFGIGFYLITILLVLKIIPTGNDIVSDRYSYVPYVGLSYCVVNLFNFEKIKIINYQKRIFSVSVIALLIVLFAVLSKSRIKIWANEAVLWSDVIKKQPESAIAFNERGRFYLNTNRINKALLDFDTSIKIDSNFYLPYFNKGILFTETKNYSESLLQFNKAILLNSKRAEIFTNRGKVYTILKRQDEALADFKHALELDPILTSAYNNLGILLADQEKNNEAIVNFNKSIELNPYQKEAYINRGKTYYRNGEYTKAKKDLYRIKRPDEKVIMMLANCEFNDKNIQKTEKLLSEIIEIDKENKVAYTFRANIYAMTKQYKKAIKDYSIAISIDSSVSDIFLNRGNSYYLMNNIENATSDWKKAADMGNSNAIKMLEKQLSSAED